MTVNLWYAELVLYLPFHVPSEMFMSRWFCRSARRFVQLGLLCDFHLFVVFVMLVARVLDYDFLPVVVHFHSRNRYDSVQLLQVSFSFKLLK